MKALKNAYEKAKSNSLLSSIADHARTVDPLLFEAEPMKNATHNASTAKQRKNPNVRDVIPFFRVLRMDRSLEYYVAGLGFTIEDTWEVD